MAFPFSCRTLAPWKEDRWGFTTAAGFKHWLDHIAGTDAWTWGQIQGVRTWLQGAKEGDELYLDDDLQAVSPDDGEILIRCNYPRVV
jgi:hypothetical protein